MKKTDNINESAVPETTAAPPPEEKKLKLRLPKLQFKKSAPVAETTAAEEPKAEPQSAEEQPKKAKAEKKAKAPKEKPAKTEPNTETAKEKKPMPAWLRKLIIVLLIVVASTAFIFCGMIVGGYYVTKSERNLFNVYVADIPVGRLTYEETLEVLRDKEWDELVSNTLTVTFPADVKIEVDYTQAGANLTSETAAQAAFRHGHDGTVFENLFAFLGSFFTKTDVSDTETRLDPEYIMECVELAATRFAEQTSDTSYKLDEKNSIMTLMKGAGAMKIDAEAAYEAVAQALIDEKTEISYTEDFSHIKNPNFQKMHEELLVDAADAYYDKENKKIVPDIKGIDFDVQEAIRLWNETEFCDDVSIPVNITMPETTAEELEQLLFRDKLGEKTTYYYGSTDERIHNIKLVADKLNGLVLLPGEEFSFNGYIGKRTAEAGFQYAGAYANGAVVQEIGGGICQASSTLYFATMAARLETVERSCHYFPVGYLPAGLDATVSWPSVDFKFRNSLDFPIVIYSSCNLEDDSITVEIWGSNVDGIYCIPKNAGTWIIYDDEFTDVAIGYGAVAYRYYYDKDGNPIGDELEDYSKYNYHPEDIKWPEPSPSPTPEIEVTTPPVSNPEPTATPESNPQPEPEPEPEPTVEIEIIP